MTIYVSECEAMQWTGDWVRGEDQPDGFTGTRIVAWVNANGGEAQYHAGIADKRPQHILVRREHGWEALMPGDYVVKGSATFHVDGQPTGAGCRDVLDFRPCDRETFERDWAPKT